MSSNNPLLGDDEDSPVGAEDLAKSIDSLLGSIALQQNATPLQSTAPKKPKKPIRPKSAHVDRILPLSVSVGETEIPEGAKDLNLTNVVNVPTREITRTLDNVNLETKRLSRRLMRKLVPLLLSYNSSTQYVQAAMREGLGFELSFDANVAEAIKNIGHLNIMFHFIKHSPIPKDLKQHFMFELSKQLATRTFENLVNKPTKEPVDLASAIHAIIGGRKSSTPREENNAGSNKEKPRMPGLASRRRRD